MVKIILLQGMHPNESPVAKEVAKRLKSALEARGHQVKLVNAPKEYRAQRQASNPCRPEFGMENDGWGFGLRKANPDSSIIELHTTPDHDMFRGENPALHTKARKWKAVYMPKCFPSVPGPLLLMTNAPGWHVLETPAKYNMENPLQDPRKARASVDDSKRANYLSPTMIGKVAHLVNTIVNTEHGIYRMPRGMTHKKRGMPYSEKPLKLFVKGKNRKRK